MEIAGNAGATIATLTLALFATMYGSISGLTVFYVFAALLHCLLRRHASRCISDSGVVYSKKPLSFLHLLVLY